MGLSQSVLGGPPNWFMAGGLWGEALKAFDVCYSIPLSSLHPERLLRERKIK